MKNDTQQSGWPQHSHYHIEIKLLNNQTRLIFNNIIVVDSNKTLILQEEDHALIYYFPREHIRIDLLYRTTKTSFCPFKGNATYWALVVGNQRVEKAAWSYKDPYPQVKEIKNHIAFYPEVIDELITF